MNKPEWGIYPEEKHPIMYWGGRGIITYSRYSGERGLDIPWDRQSFECDDPTNKEEFMDWLNDHAIPYLVSRVQQYSTKHIECSNRDGRFHCIAEDRNGSGYLYIGAWEGQE